MVGEGGTGLDGHFQALGCHEEGQDEGRRGKGLSGIIYGPVRPFTQNYGHIVAHLFSAVL